MEATNSKGLEMILVHTWKALNATFEARASEWCLSGAATTFGILCFMNPVMMQQSAFSRMTGWLSQETWGWIFLLVGIARICVLFVNGSYWRTPHARSLLAAASALLWFHLCLAMFHNLAMAASIFPWLFALDAYNSSRVGREAGVSEALHRKGKRDARHGTIP